MPRNASVECGPLRPSPLCCDEAVFVVLLFTLSAILLAVLVFSPWGSCAAMRLFAGVREYAGKQVGAN